MSKRLTKLAAAVIAAAASPAHGLGLGKLELFSALNQPLVAEIEVFGVASLNRSQIRASLASDTDFMRAGVEPESYLFDLQFAIELNGDGTGIVRITSPKPIVEPYLDFVLDVSWPEGRVLREYTALLDFVALPEQASSLESSPSVAEATAATATIESQRKAEPVVVEEPVADHTVNARTSDGSRGVRTQVGDTLWNIALKVRPHRGVSAQQTMLALQRLNPNAFYSGNINRLKAGHVLRIPTEQEIAQLNGLQAAQRVANQNQNWQEGADTRYEDQSFAADSTSASDSDGGYLKLSRSSGGINSVVAEQAATEAASNVSEVPQAVQEQLTSTLEDLDRSQRENAELAERLAKLEEAVQTMQRLISLKDAELARLQNAQPVTEPVVAPAPPVTQGSAAGGGILSWLANNGLFLGAGALLAGLLGALVWQRRKAQSEHPTDDDAIDPAMPEVDLSGVASSDGFAEVAAEAENDDFEELKDFDHELDLDTEDLDAVSDLDPAPATDSAGDAASLFGAPTENIDEIIGEADIYIAYGRFEKAIGILTGVIAERPDHIDLRIKLLEAYVYAGDKSAFTAQYQELQALNDDTAIGQVADLVLAHDTAADWLDGLETGDEQALLSGGVETLDWDISANFDATEQQSVSAAEAASDDKLRDVASDMPDLDGEELDLGFDLDMPDAEADLSVDSDGSIVDEFADVDENELLGEDSDLDLLGADLADDDTFGVSFDDSESLDSMFEADDDPFGNNAKNSEQDSVAVASLDAPAVAAAGSVDASSDELDDLDLDFTFDEAPDDVASSEDENVVLGDVDDDWLSGLEDTEAEDSDELDLSDFDIESDDGDDIEGFDLGSLDAESSDSDEFNLFDGDDEVATKLDLARAYIDMGDAASAEEIIADVLAAGSDDQRAAAIALQADIKKS